MEETIYLYNQEMKFLPRLKSYAYGLMGKKSGGPKAVEESLKRGLAELGVNFKLNEKKSGPINTACVISGAGTLQWAIKQKKNGKIKNLIAGPNICLPLDYGRLIFNKAIDIFLVPSEWVAKFCCSFEAEFNSRVKIWAAGVKTEKVGPKASILKCLIYKKTTDGDIFEKIIKTLDAMHIPYSVIGYGKYTQVEYYKLLEQASFLIFLSRSESQGIALNEAWMKNIPTLVWNGSNMVYGNYEWQESSAAPYLKEECGMFFQNAEDFPAKLEDFLGRLPFFAPRQYHLNNFTDKIAAANFLKILNNLN